MKVFTIIAFIFLLFNIGNVESGSPQYQSSTDLPPLAEPRTLEHKDSKSKHVEMIKQIIDNVVEGDMHEALEQAKEIADITTNDEQAKTEIEETLERLFKEESC